MASSYGNDDPQLNGDQGVHVSTCTYFPSRRTYLGEFASCGPAVSEAKAHQADPQLSALR